MKLKQLSIEALSALTAQPDAQAAGGCICAMTGASAAALCALTAGLAVAHGHTDMQDVVEEANAHRLDLLNDMQYDTDAYGAYMAARKLPPGADRDQRVEATLRTAIEVSLDIAQRILRVLDLLEQVLPYCPKSALGDVQVAILLGRDAAQGSLMNARTNADLLPEEKRQGHFVQKMAQLYQRLDLNFARGRIGKA